MRLAWLCNSRPDLQYELSQLAQVTQLRYDEEKKNIVRKINNSASYVLESPAQIKFPELNPESLRIVGYSEAGYASNHGLSF